MKITVRHLLLGFSSAALFVAGVAFGQTSLDRYFAAEDNIVKADALLKAITPINSAEKRQRDKAITSLASARAQVRCARARFVDAGATCP